MNISKKIWFGLFICLGLLLFSKQSIGRINNEYSIIGNITNLPDGTIFYLIKYKGRYSADTIMQTQSKQGRFVFNGRLLLEGELHFVKMDTSIVKLAHRKNSWIRLLLDHSLINLRGDIKNWPDIAIEGSVPTNEFNRFIDSTKQADQEYSSKMKNGGIADTLLGNKYAKELKKALFEYFNKHSDSYNTALQLHSFRFFHLQDKLEGYNRLTVKIKNSFYGRKLKEELDMPAELAKRAKENGDFLVANSKRKNVLKLPNGLQYEVLKSGNGSRPSYNDNVKVKYVGNLINGEKFDSSFDASKPLEISLQSAIKGWKEAIVLMPVGSKWKIYVPANLGYDDSAKPKIPARSVLIFEIELLEIMK